MNSRPPTPLSDGHIALLVQAGAANGVIGQGESSHVLRVTTSKVEGQPRIEGKKTITRERFQTRIRILTKQGTIEDIEP